LILMRWLPKLFLPILVASVLLLSGGVRCDQISRQKQELPQQQQSSASEHANIPSGMIVDVHEEESADPEIKVHEPPEIRLVVPPVTVAKGCFDYAVSAITLIFAFALVVIGALQWRTYEAQRVIQREQMLLTHRPLIRVRDITFASEPVPDGPIEVCFEFANIGASTATIISSNVTITTGPADVVPWRMFSRIPQPFDEEVDTLEKWIREHHKDDPRPTLDAGLTLNMTKKARLGLHTGQRKQLDDGILAVWAVGFVFYQDGAGQHRKMGFCYQAKTGFNYRFHNANDPDLSYEE
jgi:hypothetical protein